jgi:hypothetical protein
MSDAKEHQSDALDFTATRMGRCVSDGLLCQALAQGIAIRTSTISLVYPEKHIWGPGNSNVCLICT